MQFKWNLFSIVTYVVSFCREVSGGLLIKLGCGKVGTRSGISGRLVGYVKNENRKKRALRTTRSVHISITSHSFSPTTCFVCPLKFFIRLQRIIIFSFLGKGWHHTKLLIIDLILNFKQHGANQLNEHLID